MDEGFWVSVDDLRTAADKLKVDFNTVYDLFDFEEDAGKIRIHTVRSKSRIAEDFLAKLGRGIDLQLLPEPREKIRLEFDTKTPCASCGSTSNCVRVHGVVSLCYTCLSEMVIFYEMEKEKRDSRTTEIFTKMWKEQHLIDWPVLTNQGIIRNEGV